MLFRSTLSQNYLLPIISVLAENTLLKTAYHFLLLLVGFDTLTFRKDYDRSPTLVGHHGADHNTSIKMLKEVIFPRFGVPRYLMTDGGLDFIHGAFRKMLARYDVNHRIASPYHP